MKNRIFTLGVMALLFAACSVNELDIATPDAKEAEEFFATIEDASTRVFVDDDLMVLWHADDRVSIFNKYTYNQQYRFTGNTGANSGSFTKVPNDDFVTGNTLSYVYAIYPYKESTEISNQGVLTIDLPATQSYAENSFGIGANTMVSCSEGNELLFKNLCGYIMLKLYGDDVTVKSLSIKGNDDEPLAGKASVNASVDNAPSLTFDASATKEITLNFDTPVTLGTNAETATTFWLVVPPTTFSKGITLTVKDNKNGEFKKSTTASLQVSRNTLKRLTALQVNPEPSDDAIVFADQKLKEKLVAKFDANGDGELSYREAADVSSIEGAVTIKTITSFDEFQYFTGVNSIPNEYFKDWTYLKSIILPPRIHSIGDSAFYNCNNLSSIILSGELTEIGRLAFYGCSVLDDVLLPDGLRVIGVNAFVGCESLTKMTIPEGVTSIVGLFVNCSMLETVELPQSLVTIGSSCFTYCANLSSIIIPESVTTIGDYAFDGCYRITSVRIPSKTTLIKLGAFRDCRSLESIIVDSQNTVYDSRSNCNAIIETKTNTLIEGCSNSTIPEGITTIGVEAFAGRTNLKSVIIPDSVTTISRQAFRGTGLISVSIPESISIIQEMTFDSCSNLISVILPLSISSIRSRAFGYCSGLESIIVYPIAPPTLSWDSFKNTSGFSIFVPASSVEAYKSAENWSNYADRIQAIHEYVEMGDGLKWATMNIGATRPEEYGDYFAWGETLPYYSEGQAQNDPPEWRGGKESGYSWNSYAFTGDNGLSFNKYNSTNSVTLEPQDDAATANWGKPWRMPTSTEWNNLLGNCSKVWTDNYNETGIAGYIITSNIQGYRGNSIFLPAAGSRFDTVLWYAGSNGNYWSSSLNEESLDKAWSWRFGRNGYNLPTPEHNGSVPRYNGYSIRPVSD